MTERRDEDGALAETLSADAPLRAEDLALASTLAGDPSASAEDPALARTVASSSGTVPKTRTPGANVTVEPRALTAEHPGRYERKDEIGRGGMGRVLLVRDTHLGRDVAMKELHDASTESDGVSVGAATRFLREARVTGRLEHPGIVPVHELGQHPDGTIYYTMKRIRGRSLARALSECKTLEERLRLMRSFRDVCDAMAYAHSRGVVHRDLKPDNVMVGEFGDTLVVDWGLAKVKGERESIPARPERTSLLPVDSAAQTIDGAAMGTPSYMSPEQARGDVAGIDERTDVWGLGAILFEILTGRPPFVGTSTLEVLARVTVETPPRVRDVCPDAPPELAAIADRSLMRDPSSRYPSAADVAREIAAFQDGRMVSAYEYSGLDLLRRFVKKNRAASVAALTIVLAVLLASVLVYASFKDEQQARNSAEAARDEAMVERANAMESAHEAEVAVAEALLDRAERALASGDPSGAAVFAAGMLARVERMEGSSDDEVDTEAERRSVRALSLYIEAEASRRYVFERSLPGAHTAGALAIDGRTVAMPGADAIRLVSLEGQEERSAAVAASRVRALDGEGRVVVVGDASGIYDLRTGELLHASPPPTGASIGRAGFVLSAADGSVLVISPDGREELDRFQTEHRGAVRVGFSPAGDRLAVVGPDLPRVELWSWPRGSSATSLALPALPHMPAFSPRGDRLAVMVGDTALPMISLEGTPAVHELPSDGWPTAIAWESGGAIAIVEDSDRVVLRDPATGVQVDALHLPQSNGGRVEAGGERIVFFPLADDGEEAHASIFHRSPSASREVVQLPTAVRDLVIDAPRDRIIVSTISTILSVAIDRRGRLGVATELAEMPREAGFASRLAVGSDGTIAAVTTHGALVVFEAPTYAPVVVRSAPLSSSRVFLGITFSPDAHDIYTGSPTDGRILRWSRVDRAEGAPFEGHTGSVGALAVSPDGMMLASGATDGTARLWTLATRALRRTLEGHENRAASVAFSPDGTKLATADGTGHVRIIETRDGRLVASGAPHDRWINHIGWSSDGRWLVTAADDCSVRVLAPDDLRVVRIVRSMAAPTTAELGSDGTRLVFHDGRELVRLDVRLTMRTPNARELLEQAESTAGVTLDGLMLRARELAIDD